MLPIAPTAPTRPTLEEIKRDLAYKRLLIVRVERARLELENETLEISNNRVRVEVVRVELEGRVAID